MIVLERFGHRIRRVRSDGIITTIAGVGCSTFGCGSYGGDGGPARQALLNEPRKLAVGPDGSIFVSDYFNHRVRRVAPAFPGIGHTGDILVGSEDGATVNVFDDSGRHVRTVHALTGGTLADFTYNTAGHVTQIRDGDNNFTTIERNASGAVTAIIGPFGQRTEFTLHSSGYVASMTTPALETTEFTYTGDGLIDIMTDPRDNLWNYDYDPDTGRLALTQSHAGPRWGIKSLCPNRHQP